MKQRETLKEHIETGCLILGWKRWIIAGIVLFTIIWITEKALIAVLAEQGNIFLNALISKTKTVLLYTKIIATAYCLGRACCEAREKD